MSQFSGSLGVTVELSVFWGVGVRTHAYTSKYGGPPRQFLKTQFCFGLTNNMVMIYLLDYL